MMHTYEQLKGVVKSLSYELQPSNRFQDLFDNRSLHSVLAVDHELYFIFCETQELRHYNVVKLAVPSLKQGRDNSDAWRCSINGNMKVSIPFCGQLTFLNSYETRYNTRSYKNCFFHLLQIERDFFTPVIKGSSTVGFQNDDAGDISLYSFCLSLRIESENRVPRSDLYSFSFSTLVAEGNNSILGVYCGV